MSSRWIFQELINENVDILVSQFAQAFSPTVRSSYPISNLFNTNYDNAFATDLSKSYPYFCINFSKAIFISKYLLQTTKNLRFPTQWIVEAVSIDGINLLVSNVSNKLCDIGLGYECGENTRKIYSLTEGIFTSISLHLTTTDSLGTWELSLSFFDIFGYFYNENTICQSIQICKKYLYFEMMYQLFCIFPLISK